MDSRWLRLRDCRFALLTDGDAFVGLGRAEIGQARVRSGRLPLRPCSQTFSGLELSSLLLREVVTGAEDVRIRLEAQFSPLPVKLMRDHSFDPIHDTGDWGAPRVSGTGELDLVLRPARDSFNGVDFEGFAYHWEYRSADVPIFYLLDRASWELDGDIEGATVVSQSSCSDPIVCFEADTSWTTEGLIYWEPDAPNPVMTHNLPRWVSHQAFDFQHKGGRTLLGVFERVDLIRSVLRREPGKGELKTFDKHIFDQTTAYSTSPKKVMLSTGAKSQVDQQNVWTWVMDEVHARARAEFGLAEEPLIPRVSMNYWENFTVETYYEDLLPGAVAIGARQVFIDNLKKSAMTERCPHPGVFHWNMCCGHEYEISPALGGAETVKEFVSRCRQEGVQVLSWTNNDQALSSPVNRAERDDRKWFVLLEDTRQKFGGAYAGVMSVLDFKRPDARRYFVESHIRIKDQTGLDGYLFDSFYNLGFMPISYRDGTPTTMWRECLAAVKELQDGGVHFLIESFGPFGQPQHGCPKSYDVERCWVCYKIGLGNDYTTVPVGPAADDPRVNEAAALYYVLAHMTCPPMPLFQDNRRIDARWTEAHKQALRDYHACRADMARRYLQEDGKAVLWHDAGRTRATIWHFAQREVVLPGRVTDVTARRPLPAARTYRLEACHTYVVEDAELPVVVSEGEQGP